MDAAKKSSRSLDHGKPPALLLKLVVLVLFLFSPLPVAAQKFGQWWWDGSIGGSSRSYDNLVDGNRVSGFDQDDLRLSFGVNGYIVHPAVAGFRIGVDALLSSIDSGHKLDSDRTGFDANLSIFPRGAYPFRLYVERQLYDYGGLAEEDPLTFIGTPEISTSWGGRLRIRRGPLRGASLGFDRSILDFVSPGRQVEERQFFDWSGSGGKLQRHVRFERAFRDFGTVDFATEDLTLNLDQRGKIADDWRWDLFGIALRRSLRVGAAPKSDTDSVRLRTSFQRDVPRRDGTLSLTWEGGAIGGTGTGTTVSQVATGRYGWRQGDHWELAPFARIGMQRADDAHLVSPQLGIATTWSRRGTHVDASIGGSVSYLVVDQSGAAGAGKDSVLALAFETSLGHGDEQQGLRRELELAASRNDLRQAGRTVAELPDLGRAFAGTGTEDFYRGRVTLRRRFGRFLGVTYGEWSRRMASENTLTPGFRVDTLTYSLQLSGSRFSLVANAGNTAVEETSAAFTVDGQEVSFTSASISFRPWRSLSFRAAFRIDERVLDLAPDVDGERAEAGLELRFGEIVFTGQIFESEERLRGGVERINRGLKLGLSRRLAGWLPVVTSTERRGVIR